MNRLTHSFAGFRRSMQMSRVQAYVFIEGKTDVYFYEQVCDPVCSNVGVEYRICKPDELHGNRDAGGKSILIKFFDYLNKNSSLCDNFKGKSTVSIFFLDKDVDDFTNKIITSDHVSYTTHYTIENHFFTEGELSRAAAIASSLETRLIANHMGNEAEWRLKAAECWKDWVKLCLYAKKKRINCECTFSSISRINSTNIGIVSQVEYSRLLNILQSRSGLSPQGFNRSFKIVSNKVDYLYRNGMHDSVFKGKWYALFLEEEIKNAAGSTPYEHVGIKHRIKSCVVSTLNFNHPWLDQFRNPLRVVLSKL